MAVLPGRLILNPHEYIITTGTDTKPRFYASGGFAGQGGFIHPLPKQPVDHPFEMNLLYKLGVDVRMVPESELLTLTGYIKRDKDDPALAEFVEWTPEQQAVIDAVWHLIDESCKVE